MDSTAEVAQVVEHGTENAGVDSSSLSLGTINSPGFEYRAASRKPGNRQIGWATSSGSGSVVEHLLAKEGVASSNLVFRSKFLKSIPSPSHLRRPPHKRLSRFCWENGLF